MKVLLLPNGLNSTITDAIVNGHTSRKIFRRAVGRKRFRRRWRWSAAGMNVCICREGMDTSLDNIEQNLRRLFEKLEPNQRMTLTFSYFSFFTPEHSYEHLREVDIFYVGGIDGSIEEFLGNLTKP